MHQDIEALLAVQNDDTAIRDVEDTITGLAPRVTSLIAECERARASLASARALLDEVQQQRKDLEFRAENHQQLQARNQTAMNSVTNQREAAAATAQSEQLSRILDDERKTLAQNAERADEIKRLIQERELALAEAEEAYNVAEMSVSEDRAKLQAELAKLKTARESHARGVPRSLLGPYDRIASRKRAQALYPLRGASCSNCDTMLPLQRRTQMSGRAMAEVCEGCGKLLYATD